MTTTSLRTASDVEATKSPAKPPSSTTESSRRAYERRQRRRQKISASRLVGPGKPVASALNRAPFVVVLIVLLAGGISGVLYLNTLTDEAGMRTSAAKSRATDLRLTIESLRRDVALLDATPQIADAAAGLGMVPAGDSALLIVDATGAGSIVGEPSVVPGPVPPPDPAAEAAAAAAAQAAAEAAAAQAAAAQAAAAQAAAAQAAAAQAAAAQAAAAPPVDQAAAATPAVDPAATTGAPVDQAVVDAAAAAAAAAAAPVAPPPDAPEAAAQAAAAAAAAQAAAAAAQPDPNIPVDPNTPAQGAEQQ